MIDSQDRELLLDHEKIADEKKKYELGVAIHEKYLDDWREVLSTAAGRRIIWDLLGGMGFQRNLFNSDPLIMAANCGQHKIALSIAKDIEEAIPGIFARMTNEFRSAQANKKE